MPQIEIITQTVAEGEPFSTHGTVLKVDGREIDEVTDIGISLALGDVVRVNVSVLATERLHFESGASLHVDVVVSHGYRVLAEPLPDGRFSYTAERIELENERPAPRERHWPLTGRSE